MDHAERAAGDAQRFGIVHADDETQARTPTASARVYADAIRSHGAAL